MSIGDQLRKAIVSYGSLYAVAKDSGLPYSLIYQFMKGEGTGLRLHSIETLCDLFGMRLTAPRKRRKQA